MSISSELAIGVTELARCCCVEAGFCSVEGANWTMDAKKFGSELVLRKEIKNLASRGNIQYNTKTSIVYKVEVNQDSPMFTFDGWN